MPDTPHDMQTLPTVAILTTGPRYSVNELIGALPTGKPTTSSSGAVQNAEAATSARTAEQSNLGVQEAVKHFSFYEQELWLGEWRGYREPLTNEAPYPSQSEADYGLARKIAHWGAGEGIAAAELRVFVARVFEQSGLAQRPKWTDRASYRELTIEAACDGIVPMVVPNDENGAPAPLPEPDWALKGDLIAVRFFRDTHQGKLVFVRSINQWLRWDITTAQWLWCYLGEETELAKKSLQDLYRLACVKAADKPDGGPKLVAEIAALQREPRIRAVLSLSKSEPGMSLLHEDLDKHPTMLGVKNGVVDLKTGALKPNDPTLFITKYVDIDYDPDAQCPAYHAFLHDVLEADTATIAAVQRLVGLTLTGIPDEEIIVFCIGTGANGKSIFSNVIYGVFGPYAKTAPSTLLSARRTDDHGPRSDLAMLAGSRLVSINELPGGMTLDETVTKQLAGREPISARFLHQEFFTFLPCWTPWVRTNHKPIVKGTDNAIWRRLVIIPFRRTFTPQEQDPNLEEKLRREGAGVLAWMVQGAQAYIRNGLLQSPAMKSELAQYRTSSDLMGEFLDEKTEADPTAEVKQSALYFDYRHWCDGNGLRPASKRAFSEQLAERGYDQRKSGKDRYYTGLRGAPVFK